MKESRIGGQAPSFKSFRGTIVGSCLAERERGITEVAMEKPIKAQTDASGRPLTGRPVIYATQGLISSGHYLTSMAGMQMLLAGGNAFDAVVAAGFAAAVIEPIASYSLGAESVFMFYHAASGDLLSLSGQGTAPARATVDFYRDQGLDCIPTGPGSLAHLSFTVPGVVDAYLSLLERYGTLSLARVLEPAIQLAESGFPHYEYMVDALDCDATREQFALYPPGDLRSSTIEGLFPGLAHCCCSRGWRRSSSGWRSTGLRVRGSTAFGQPGTTSTGETWLGLW